MSKKPECPHCLDIPLFGCVSCPRSPTIWDLKKRIREFIENLKNEDEVYRSEQVIEILEELKK